MAVTNTSIDVKFLRTGKHFDSDTTERDIYEITLISKGRRYKFNFGQSIHHSGEYVFAERLKNKVYKEKVFPPNRAFMSAAEYKNIRPRLELPKDVIKNPHYSVPTVYDVLCCLTKYDPGTFADFCSEFGYDTDSRKAEKTYKAVLDEYLQVSRLFTESELELMQEIQ